MFHTRRSFGGALVLILACVVSAVVACNDHQLTGPGAPTPQPPLFSQGSPDVPVQGCAKWSVTLTGGTGITVTSVAVSSCGPIVPLLVAPASYDPATKTISLPLADSNSWTREVVAPARNYAWNDSISITAPTGLVNGSSGTYLRLTGMDSTIGSSASTFKNARLWKYDTLLAAHGLPQTLFPTIKSRTAIVKIQVVSGSPTAFTVLVRVQAQNANPVPSIPPSAAPVWFREDSSWEGAQHRGYLKGVLTIIFKPNATQAQKQQAVDAVVGKVVGGGLFGTSWGHYYVQIADDGKGTQLTKAIATLRALSQVLDVGLTYRGDPGSRYPNDGAGWNQWKLTPDSTNLTRENWPLEMIAAPLAWGCSVGDSSVHIAVLDHAFNDVELKSNVAPAYWSVLGAYPADTNDHGTQVTVLLGAAGNNGQGMTGTMWSAGLRLHELTSFSATFSDYGIALRDEGLAGTKVVNFSYWKNWHRTPGGAADLDTLNQLYARMKPYVDSLVKLKKMPLLVTISGDASIDASWSVMPLLRRDFPTKVLVVGGNRLNRTRSSASGTGSLVDVYAPGDGIVTLTMKHGVVYSGVVSGTSFSAAYVSGVAGLLLAFDPRLTPDTLRQLILTGALNGGRQIVPNTPDAAYILNAYEALKAAGARKKSPLCGNRVYGIDNVITAVRSGGAADILQTYAPTIGPIEHLQAAHGGQWLEFLDPASNTRARLTFSNGTWQPGVASCVNCSALSGAARSGDASVFGGAVHSHGGDSTLYWSAPTVPPYQTLPQTFTLSIQSGSSAVQFGSTTDQVLVNTAFTFVGAPGALAYSPTGDFVLYSTYDYRIAGNWFDTHIYRVALPSGQTTNIINLPQQDAPWMAISEDGTELTLGSSWIGGCSVEYWSLKTNTQIPNSQVFGVDTLGSTTNNAGYPTCFLGGSFSADRVAGSGPAIAAPLVAGAPHPTPPSRPSARRGGAAIK